VTPDALNTLARDIAEAAAKCVGCEARSVAGATNEMSAWSHTDAARVSVSVAADAGEWKAYACADGHTGAALNSAAALALRDRVVAQREERARMLAADDAALRVIDGSARMYDAALIGEAVSAMESDPAEVTRMQRGVFAHLTAGNPDVRGPWTRAQVDEWDSGIADACDAILRRRAGTP
jgi:hypothetical protein